MLMETDDWNGLIKMTGLGGIDWKGLITRNRLTRADSDLSVEIY
jgi:hypothetical protein